MSDAVSLRDVVLDPRVARRLDALAKKLDRTIEERNQLIVEAHREGAGLREIARAAGMTHPGVKDIIQRHIVPFSEAGTDTPDNLLVLSADDHAAYDSLPNPEDDPPGP